MFPFTNTFLKVLAYTFNPYLLMAIGRVTKISKFKNMEFSDKLLHSNSAAKILTIEIIKSCLNLRILDSLKMLVSFQSSKVLVK